MKHSTLLVPILHGLTALGAYTNLPDVAPGVFNASTRIIIRSTVPAAWHALTDFAAYPEWNPFVRQSLVVTPLNITLPDQYPVEGASLFLRTQIPPLPLPVNRDTREVLLNTQYSLENITHVQPKLGRLAWEYATDLLIQAERWSAVSDLGDGTVLYESREVFNGLGAGAVKKLMGNNLQVAFDAQSEGLKLWLERGNKAQ